MAFSNIYWLEYKFTNTSKAANMLICFSQPTELIKLNLDIFQTVERICWNFPILAWRLPAQAQQEPKPYIKMQLTTLVETLIIVWNQQNQLGDKLKSS